MSQHQVHPTTVVIQQAPSNSLALASFVCGLLAIFTFCVPVLPWILAGFGILCGAIALFVAIGRRGAGVGFAIIGLLMSGFAFLPIILLGGILATGAAVSKIADSAKDGAKDMDAGQESQPTTKRGNKTVTTTAPEKPKDLFVCTPEQLIQVYEENAVNADKQVKGKLLAVRGDVQSIGKDIMNKPYVTLKGGTSRLRSVQCMFSKNDEAALAPLRQGDTVTIAGTCSGKMMNVILHDCWFYEETAITKPEAKSKPSPRPTVEQQPKSGEADHAPPKPPVPMTRTWTDNTGDYKVEAEFHGYASGTVTLKKADGQLVKLPMERLSQSDQEWIRKRGKR